MDVDALGYERQRNHVDIVAGLARSWFDSWRLDKTWEAFAVSIDRWVDPISNWDVRTYIRIRG
jgi:hypothetical protein